MNLQEFKQTLKEHPNHGVLIQIEGGQTLAPHFHVTEVGLVTKDFVDCGGTRRTTNTCRLQTLVANDIDHRLSTDKLSGILKKTIDVLHLDPELTVEIEIQTDTISIYELSDAVVDSGKIKITARTTRTACLAPDTCRLDMLPVLGSDCSGETGCC